MIFLGSSSTFACRLTQRGSDHEAQESVKWCCGCGDDCNLYDTGAEDLVRHVSRFRSGYQYARLRCPGLPGRSHSFCWLAGDGGKKSVGVSAGREETSLGNRRRRIFVRDVAAHSARSESARGSIRLSGGHPTGFGGVSGREGISSGKYLGRQIQSRPRSSYSG